jgi:putative oxidoreductase
MERFLETWTPRVLSVMRIVSALLLMQHGGQKLAGFPAPQRYEFDLLSLSGVAGVLELFGGFMLLVGFMSRPVAFLLSGLMAFAYFIGHAPRGFWPILNGGELAAMYCFVFLYLSVAGGGVWSLDRLSGKSRGRGV